MNINKIGYGLGFLALAGCSTASEVKETTAPNILFIMSDDHTANAISSYGLRFAEILPTPNIDRLANEGAMLTNCFVTNSISTPSRATIMTGKYGHKTGVYTLWDDIVKEDDNIAKYIQASGYETAIIGKWHLHTQPNGFDYYSVLPGQGKYFNPVFKESGMEWIDNSKEGNTYEGYTTDIITDKTLDWLDGRDNSKPFFLMSHHKAPHGLWEYAPRHEHLFDSVSIPEPFSLMEDKSHRSDGSKEFGRNMLNMSTRMSEPRRGGFWPTGKMDITGMSDEERIRAAYQKYLKDYLRTVAAIDENVGRVLDYLEENDLVENTIVIYTSDQGMFLGEHSYYDKRWMFDEALKMPFLIRKPGEIEPKTKVSDVITNLDFAELLLDYAGLEIPEDMQGRSFRENLKGNSPDDWRQSMYYHYWMHFEGSNVPAHYGIRTKEYKLIFFYGSGLGLNGTNDDWKTPVSWELYDLKNDPYEVNNVYNDPDYAEVVVQMKKELKELKDQYEDFDSDYPDLEKVSEMN
ncbi:MAG: sulfatase [Bacteroidales bacterium]|nr:sulfatase [Bacteroidales bacterium]